MAFRFHHSLASRAAISVVLSLWYHEDIDCLKGERRFASVSGHDEPTGLFKMDHLIALKAKVTDRVSKRFLPKRLKRYLLEFVQITGEHLERWTMEHYLAPRNVVGSIQEGFFDISDVFLACRFNLNSESRVNAAIDVDLRKVLRWSPDGVIDLEQTGEALVRNESDPIKRFRLAIAYCREGELMRLWPSVFDHFSSPEAWDSSWAHAISALFWWRYFHHFWPKSTSEYLSYLKEAVSSRGTSLFIAELFCSCLCGSNFQCSPLTLYLLKENPLGHSSVIENMDRIANHRYAIIIFKMPESCLAQILRAHPVDVLSQLLLWPHQSFFVDTVERNWDLFDERLFMFILEAITSRAMWYDSDIYKDILRWFWTQSPARLRDVERVFYGAYVDNGHTLRCFVERVFPRPWSSAAEETMKRVLFGGRHVVELLSSTGGSTRRGVLADLVRTCFPPEEECEGKLQLLEELFAPRTTDELCDSSSSSCSCARPPPPRGR